MFEIEGCLGRRQKQKNVLSNQQMVLPNKKMKFIEMLDGTITNRWKHILMHFIKL